MQSKNSLLLWVQSKAGILTRRIIALLLWLGLIILCFINLNLTHNALAIDLGVNNLAACVSTVGTPFLMDGRILKSINHQWNKEKARLQSIAKKQGKDLTSRINGITEKRNNRVRDIIRKSARHIADYCIAQDIGSVYVGYNPDFKRSANLGDSNNQNFVQIPFGLFRKQLSFLCWKYGIDYIEQEESYNESPSLASVLPSETTKT